MVGGSKHGKDAFRLVKGEWGDSKCLPQRGIITYGLAQNRLNPLAGILKAAIFNTSRRASSQVLHWGVPLLAAYSAMNWAIEKNKYYNSKLGRKQVGSE